MTKSKLSHRFPKLIIASTLMLLAVHAFALDWSPYGDPPNTGGYDCGGRFTEKQ